MRTLAPWLASIVAGAACGEARDIELVPLEGPPSGACGLEAPAFCDSFDEAAPGGRAGDLDERFWSVARVTQGTNPSQGYFNAWHVSIMKSCEGPRHVVPGQDLVVCANADGNRRLLHSFHDGGNFALQAIRPRRPFDCSGRTGRIAFDVDAWYTRGHGTWLEVWVTDEPVPAPHHGGPGVLTVPRNGVAIAFDKDCGTTTLSAGVRAVSSYKDHQLLAEAGDAAGGLVESRCFRTQRMALNHLEIRMNRTEVQVWASDADAPETHRRVARASGLALPLERGYVHFLTVHMNASKDGNPPDETHVWDNIGFDGPLRPLPLGYDVPDNLRWVTRPDTSPETVMNTGWGLAPSRPLVFRVEDLLLRAGVRAWLTLDANNFEAEAALRVRVNGSEPHDTAHAFPTSTGRWRALALPVPLAELRDGENTIELLGVGTSTSTNIANAELTVDVR